MRAVLCRAQGKPEDLIVDDIPSPTLTENSVRIAVRAAGVNFADTLLVSGRYQIKPPYPFSPGLEVAGEVIEVAKGVRRCKKGDRVMAVLDYGGFAEEVAAKASDVFNIPDDMDFETAAAFPVAYGTSHLGLKLKAHLNKGETLLVNGAAGGVGLTAVEIGKLLGATVIAAARGTDRLKVATESGADLGVDYTTENLHETVKRLTGGRGADVVYDPIGGPVFEASLRAVAPGGRILAVGFASGQVPQIPANILLIKNISVFGYYWGAYRTLDPALIDKSFKELFSWFSDGKLKPHVSETLPLEKAAEALGSLVERRSTGKIVLTP
ncbi:MAG: NADPH:quinone oxidoreductase family protein [Rhodospirillales bacterium]|nr:NADPH:quinone oxidoreductase family protein [Rhodospirillales bacterium]